MDIATPVMKADVLPQQFVEKYVKDPDGSHRAVEWVEYFPRGQKKYTIVSARIVDVMRATDGTWECLKPYYDAWKEGREAPVFGTPLAAWSGVTPEQAEVLRVNGIKTVEDVAVMNDATMTKVGLPGIRTIRDAAKGWEAAKDTRAVEADMQRMRDENEALRAQMESLMAMMGEQARDNVEEPVKRRPGRPRKDDDAEAA